MSNRSRFHEHAHRHHGQPLQRAGQRQGAGQLHHGDPQRDGNFTPKDFAKAGGA